MLYKFGGFQWSGNTLHTSDELSKIAKLESGQVAGMPKIRAFPCNGCTARTAT